MKIISLKCNNCSADLNIPDKATFFRCAFCNSSLGIKHSGTAIYTEVLEDIKEDTEQILENTSSILVEKKIDRLDRDWEQTKKSYTSYSKEGIPSLPEKSGIVGTLIGVTIFSIFLTFIITQIKNNTSNSSTEIRHRLGYKMDDQFFENNPHLKDSPVFKKEYQKLQKRKSSKGFGDIGLFCLIFLILGVGSIYATSIGNKQAEEYYSLKAQYQEKRKDLLRELNEN